MVFMGIVLYDATGIRRQAGKHAKALNTLVDNIEKREGIEINKRGIQRISLDILPLKFL